MQIIGDAALLPARSLIIATGAEYRKPLLESLPRFEGVGVYYGATFMEAQLCVDEEVIVIGGGNSAGQAAVFLAQTARLVHILVRVERASADDVAVSHPPHRGPPGHRRCARDTEVAALEGE